MPQYFADTGFWYGLLIRRDQFHEVAVRWKEWIEANGIVILTTELVLWEVLNGCSAVSLRRSALTIYQACLLKPEIEVVELAPRWNSEALDLYASVSDKEWSLTDCFSFAVLRDRGIYEALTPDHDFVQAGFRALILEEPPLNGSPS